MVTLSKPPAGDTDWAGEINQNWTDIENALTSGQVDYVENAGFELASAQNATLDVPFPVSGAEADSRMPPWRVVTSGGNPTGTVGKEEGAGNFVSGIRSVKVNCTAGAASSSVRVFQRIRAFNVRELRGKSLTFSMEVKTSTASKAKLRLADSVGSSDSSFHTGGGTFERLSITRTIDSGASYVEVSLYVDTTAAVTVYADEAVLVYSSSAGSFRAKSPEEDIPLHRGVFQARIRVSTSTKILLAPFNGGYVDVNGEYVFIGDPMECNTTDNLINNLGGDAGAAAAASTLYYAYVSNSQASYSPLRLRLSATAPSSSEGANGLGGRYLADSGNMRNWRFVGWVRTNASTQFVDSETQRFVINYHNRRALHLRACPAYSDNNTITSYTTTSGTYVQANGGTGSRIEWVANGEESVLLTLLALVVADANAFHPRVGIAVDGTGNVRACSQVKTVAANEQNVAHAQWGSLLSEGYHFADLMISINETPNVARFYADYSRDGSSIDPEATSLYTMIMG